MSDSRRSSNSRSRSKRSKHSYRGDGYSDDDSSNSGSSGTYHSSHKEESRRSTRYSRSPDDDRLRRQEKSHTSDRVRSTEKSTHMKSLVKVPIPSLLSPPSLLSTSARNSASLGKVAKVIQNKSSGLERRNQFAKSLMDLQFEDHPSPRSSSFGYHNHHKDGDSSNQRRRNRESDGLLSNPYEATTHHLPRHDPQFIDSTERHDDDEVDFWFTPESRQLKKRSWRESSGGGTPASHPSLFNSSYKPLVVESEPLGKVRKLQLKSPKPLLDSKVLPSLTMLPTSGVLSSTPSSSSSGRKSHIESGSGGVHEPTKTHFNRIVSIEDAADKDTVYLVIPSTLPWFHIHGRAKIKVLKGVVTILTHTLTPGASYEVFSPSSNCLLSLQVDPGEILSPQTVAAELKMFVEDQSVFDRLSEKSIGILKVEKLQSVLCEYVTSLPPFTRLFVPRLCESTKGAHTSKSVGVSLFNRLTGGLRVGPESELGGIPGMAWDESFNKALDKWLETVDKAGCGEESPVLFTCGAKNAGKSMFNRCAINTTLRCVPEVAFLDCDVGQTELSPPATISLHIISKPILSPPFCHQRHAEKMVFYGDASPADDPSFYVKCLRYVYQAYTQFAAAGKKLPLIVNTMGFPEGVGFMLFIDTLNITRPDLVIQFESNLRYMNFPPVDQELVALDEGWTFNKCPPVDAKEKIAQVKNHSLVTLRSLNGNENYPTHHSLHPADLRHLTLFSALANGMAEGETLMTLAPHTVQYRHLAIHVCRFVLSVEETLLAVDASIVALCQSDLTQATRHTEDSFLTFDEIPVCECLGFGIVRAIDREKGLLYLSTTLPRHLLRRANTILKGALAFPNHFIMKQQSCSDYPVPYVDTLAHQATATFGLKPRSRMPRIHSKAKKVGGE